MFDDHIVTTDELYATGATFTVVAWGFAYVYLAVDVVWPDSFTAVGDPLEAKAWFEMLYLSVTTMTSLGLSDIVPVRPHARSFVMIEQIAGMLYLALAVARIMALTVARTTAREQRRAPEAHAPAVRAVSQRHSWRRERGLLTATRECRAQHAVREV